MKSSPGVAPFFWGACLAASVTVATAMRYPCFTAGPRAFLSHTKLGSAPYIPLGSTAKRYQLLVLAASTAADGHSSQRASATSSHPRNSEGALPSSPTSSRRHRRRVRGKTRLNSTKERSISTTQLPDDTSTIAPDAKFPQLPTIEIGPVTPQHGPVNDYDDYQGPHASGTLSLPSDTVEVENAEWLIGARSEYPQSEASVVAAGGVAQGDERSLSRERQQLMDMTLPPAELLKSTEVRPFGHRHATTAAVTIQEASSIGVENSSEGVGDIGVWASRGLLAAAAMIYGTNFGCVKMLEEALPMSLAAALRFSVSVVPFIPALLRINPAVLFAGAEIGVYNAMGYYAQSLALTTTTASKASFIGSLAVLVVPALDAMFGTKKHAGVEVARPVDRVGLNGVFAALNGPWFPAFLAAAGVACLELVGAEGDPPNVGDAWAFLQPICFATAFWRMERHCRTYAGHAWGLVGAQMLILAILSSLWCTVAGEVPPSLDGVRDAIIPESGSLAPLIAILWTGVVTTALSVYGETLAMQKVSAAESTIILSTVPIWGTLFAAALLGESVGWNNALGAVLIISACTWKSVGPTLQRRLLSMIAATGAAAGTFNDAGSEVDADELSETVGTVGTLVKDIVQDHM